MARILVGMSWWVDSAVTANLLMQQWHDVIAGFMKNYADESNLYCTTKKDRDMAIQVSQHLGIKTFVITDFRQEYDEQIIQYIKESYNAWLTPNPDVFCNSEVKFKLFLDEALKLGCDGIAMGHYAQIRQEIRDKKQETFQLLKGVDHNKDQSYFLSRLNQYQLSKAYFPIGHLTKPEVRAIAQEIWLPNAQRKDSQGLCFIGKVSIKDFLSKDLPKIPWPVYDVAWKYLWDHEGIQFYTIGQRHGFGWWWWTPRYIVDKIKQSNTLIVWPKDAEELFASELIAHEWHRIGDIYTLPFSCVCKIRYRQEDQTCTLVSLENGSMKIIFEQPQRAISSGQIVVAYIWEVCIGSGIIA
jgi:tRNA-uridine 2-sulfurtransferase